MKLTITVKPNSKRSGVEQTGEREYLIRVHEPAHEGRANDAVTRALAKHLNVSSSRIAIIRGASARRKIIEIA